MTNPPPTSTHTGIVDGRAIGTTRFYRVRAVRP
jgi:hypothetical protein